MKSLQLHELLKTTDSYLITGTGKILNEFI
jgi:hypothetical protein